MQAQPELMLLTIASVSENLFDGHARSVTLPGSEGEFTVLPHHEPIVTTLQKGKIRVVDTGGDSREYVIESGVFECASNRAVVLL